MFEDNTKKKIDKLATSLIKSGDSIAQKRIRNADFDKTLIGTVVGWSVGKMRVDNEGTEKRMLMWIILCNDVEYRVWQTHSDITSIGQQVRLYYPNNDDTNKYAEVINVAKQTYSSPHPNKCVYDSTNHTITETWALNDGKYTEKNYTLHIRTVSGSDEDEVYRLDMPDGTQIKLEGFILDNFS